MRGRARPWTRRRMRPSGSLSIRMIAATVPTGKSSLGRGVSFCASLCATSMMIRCSARAASTAVMDFSRETESGRVMNGKTTTSFNGRTGRMSGIGRSSLRSVAISRSFSSTSAMPVYGLTIDRLTIEGLGPELNLSILPSFNPSILQSFLLFFGLDLDRQLFFPQVWHAGEKDFEHTVLQLRDGTVRVDGPR